METIQKIALAITIIGALNWGLVGFFQFDVVSQFAGGINSVASRTIFIIVALSGLISLGLLFKSSDEERTDSFERIKSY